MAKNLINVNLKNKPEPNLPKYHCNIIIMGFYWVNNQILLGIFISCLDNICLPYCVCACGCVCVCVCVHTCLSMWD